jgi:hypothetical protein
VITDGGPELRVVDLSDPRQPFERARSTSAARWPARSIALRATGPVAGDPQGLGIVDLADRDRPRIVLPRDRRLRVDREAERRERRDRPADETRPSRPA